MIGAFSFYLVHSLANRIRFRLKRLRQPKYLISALVGLGYLYMILFRHSMVGRTRGMATPIPMDQSLFPLAEVGFAFILFLLVLVPWFLTSAGQGITFTEAEVQFLFPAPFRRKDLLLLRILKGQMGIVFGVLISVLIFGRGTGFFPHVGFLLITLWVVYSFLSLYRMAAALSKMSLAEHGLAGLRRQIWALLLVAAAVVSVAVWLKWFIPSPPRVENGSFQELASWLAQVAESGPAYFFLLPFRILVRPAFSLSPGVFVARLVPALVLLWLVYLWVVRIDAQFEEASVERAERVAKKLEAINQGTVSAPKLKPGKVRRAPFRLSPDGPLFVALFWKNLISAGRISRRSLVIVLAAMTFPIIVGTLANSGESRWEILASMVGVLSIAMSCFFVFLGPLMLRQDFRSDLTKMEVLKSYPIGGWSVALGEVLAPAAILAGLEWLLLLMACFAAPSLGKWDRGLLDRAPFFLGAAMLFPCFCAAGIVIQNAAVLMLPGWIQIGRAAQRGIEAMGQRLITLAATLLVLLFAGVPAAIIFGIAFFLGYWAIGFAVVPLAAMLAGIALVVEIGFAVVWLGHLYDRFDASLELPQLTGQ